MSLTGNFILWNNKSKPQMHETCCSETMSVRNWEAEHLLWRLVRVTDRNHRGWKVTSSSMQRSFLRRWPCILGSPPLPPCGSVNFLLRCQVFFLIPPKDLQIWNLHSLKRNCVGDLTQWIFLKVWMLPLASAGNTTRAGFLIKSPFLVQLTQRNTQTCEN